MSEGGRTSGEDLQQKSGDLFLEKVTYDYGKQSGGKIKIRYWAAKR